MKQYKNMTVEELTEELVKHAQAIDECLCVLSERGHVYYERGKEHTDYTEVHSLFFDTETETFCSLPNVRKMFKF